MRILDSLVQASASHSRFVTTVAPISVYLHTHAHVSGCIPTHSCTVSVNRIHRVIMYFTPPEPSVARSGRRAEAPGQVLHQCLYLPRFVCDLSVLFALRGTKVERVVRLLVWVALGNPYRARRCDPILSSWIPHTPVSAIPSCTCMRVMCAMTTRYGVRGHGSNTH